MQDMVKPGPGLLIQEDFGLKQLDLSMTQDLLEGVEEWYHVRRFIAILARFSVIEWPSVFKDQTIADAILDRLVRNVNRFDIKGYPSSLRSNTSLWLMTVKPFYDTLITKDVSLSFWDSVLARIT